MSSNLVEDKKKQALNIVIMTILIVLTFYLIFKDIPFHELSSIIGRVNPVFIIAALLSEFIFVCCEGMNLRVLIGSFGKKIPVKDCLKYAFVGFFFSALTPSSSGGQPAQIYFMSKDKINTSSALLSMLVMLATYQIVTLFGGVILFLFNPNLVLNAIKDIIPIVIFGVGANIALTLVLISAIFAKNSIERILLFGARLLAKIRLIRNLQKAEDSIRKSITEYHESAVYLKNNISILFKVLCISTTQVASELAVPFFVYLALGQRGHSYIAFATLQIWLNLAVSSLPLPGAVGAAEPCFISMFSLLIVSDLIPVSMLLSRLTGFYFYLILSGVVSYVGYIALQRRKRMDTVSASEESQS